LFNRPHFPVKAENFSLVTVAGNCTQVNGSFVRKDILGRAYLQVSCLLAKREELFRICGTPVFGVRDRTNEIGRGGQFASQHLSKRS